MALRGVYICITNGPGIKRDSEASSHLQTVGFKPISNRSSSNVARGRTDLLGMISIHLSRARVTESDLAPDMFAVHR